MLARRVPEGRKQRHMFSLRVNVEVVEVGEGRGESRKERERGVVEVWWRRWRARMSADGGW
jgi:hypothetical protein